MYTTDITIDMIRIGINWFCALMHLCVIRDWNSLPNMNKMTTYTINMIIDKIKIGVNWLGVFMHLCAMHDWNSLPITTDTSPDLRTFTWNSSFQNKDIIHVRDSCGLVMQLRHWFNSAAEQADLCFRRLQLVDCSPTRKLFSLHEISHFIYELITIAVEETNALRRILCYLFIGSSVVSCAHGDGPVQYLYLYNLVIFGVIYRVNSLYALYCVTVQARHWSDCTVDQYLLCSLTRQCAYLCVLLLRMSFDCLIIEDLVKCTVDMVLDTDHMTSCTQRVLVYNCILPCLPDWFCNVLTLPIDAGFACSSAVQLLHNKLLHRQVRWLRSWLRHTGALSLDLRTLCPSECTVGPIFRIILHRKGQKIFCVSSSSTTVMSLVSNSMTRVKGNLLESCYFSPHELADGYHTLILRLMCCFVKQQGHQFGHVRSHAKRSPWGLYVSTCYSISELYVHSKWVL